MANCCYFTMKIAGKPEQVSQFVHSLNHGFGRIYSFEADPIFAEKDPRPGSPLVAVVGQGDCAWSISTAMPKLQEESARLGLCIEAFSSEPGIGFQEHYLYDKGILLEDECVDYCEYWVSGYGEEEIQTLLEDFEMTREELFSKLNEDGDYCIGGFENFGDFEDLFGRWTPEMLKDLAPPAKDIPEKISLWARVGVSLEVTSEIYGRLIKGDPDALLDVLHGKGGEAFLDGETYFPDIPENLDLGERSYDLGREPFALGPIPTKERLDGLLQVRSTLEDLIRQAEREVAKRPEPTPPGKNTEKEPEQDY